MKLLTLEELSGLLAPHGEPCLSFFMPTHRYLPGSAEDPIRFKNLLKQAERLLSEKWGERDIRAVLAPVERLADPEFWRFQMDGLAVFRSRDELVFFRLPGRLPERVVVADSYHVRPLLPFLESNRRFYLLCLGQKAVAFYDGSEHAFGPVDLLGLPKSLTDALGLERGERLLGTHAAGRGLKAPVFHGPGAPSPRGKDDLVRFFRAIDQALWEKLRDERTPLLLAGPAQHFPLYRDVSRYPHLAPVGVEGSFEGASPEEIHQKAWPVARQVFRAVEEKGLADYERARNRGLAADVLTDVARAAVTGRVRQLLLGDHRPLYGRIDPVTGEVTLHGTEQSGPVDDDLLDDLAEAVLVRGGDVLLMPQERMPGDAAAVATLRW